MSFRPFGLGLGVIALALVWTVCGTLCFLRVRKQGNVMTGIPFIMLAGLLTALLVCWPREPSSATTATSSRGGLPMEFGPQEDQEEVDWAALPRLALAGFLLVVGLGGGLHWAKEALFEPRFVPPPSFSSSPQ